jgi:hypothetical protein
MNDWPKCDHVIVQYDVQPPVMRCERCGNRNVLTLPQRSDSLVALLKAFVQAHATCTPQPGPPV